MFFQVPSGVLKYSEALQDTLGWRGEREISIIEGEKRVGLECPVV